MISFKPRSIFQLTITGFLLVTGILVIALLTTVRLLNGLSDRSQQVISQSAQAIQASGVLIEQAAAMERNALQYNLIGEAEILGVYADRRKKFETAAQQLSSLQLRDDIKELISSLVRNEALAYQALLAKQLTSNDRADYPGLMEVTYRLSELTNSWTNEQLAAIRQETARTRNMLRVQAVVLVSLALILAGIFTALITRPLLQIEKAINQLGSGVYDKAISVKGPRDLIDLGHLLEWLRNRLGKLEKQRTSFLRHVSHELNTPLAAMQESAALLNDGVVGSLNAEQQEIIRIQSKSCQRLQTLIDELLRFNSGSFSVLNAMPQTIKMDKIIESVISAHELIIKQGNIAVRSKLDKVQVKGHAEQLRVIVDNLFTNAIKYSPDGGAVSISLLEYEQEVHFNIVDQGPGIAANDREKVFDAFYQAKPPQRNFHSSTGLGLAIAKEYTRANGGTIEIMDSISGSHFRLRFPVAAREEQ